MTRTPIARTLIALALATPLAAMAQDDTAAAQKELQAARQELQRAAKRVAELSRETGTGPTRIEFDRMLARKPRLGVLLAGDDEAGVRITGVTPESGADKAGLKAGDRVLKIAGKPIAGDTAAQRLENARAAVAKLKADAPIRLSYQRDGRTHDANVTPTLIAPRIAFNGGPPPGDFAFFGEGLDMPHLEGIALSADELRLGVAPEIQRELRRLGKLQDCKGEDCKLPALAEAFRWSGLNLASVDATLGRYFGTDAGVLVLSTGDELAGLQAGDVIRKVEGKPVATPRDVMNALRGKPGDAKVEVEYLRDRQARMASITVPRIAPLQLPMAPRVAIRAHPAPRPGEAPYVMDRRRTLIIDSDGNVQTYGDDADHPLPPPAPPPPPPPPSGKGALSL